MCISSKKYWSVCVLTYLIDQSSVIVDFLQLSPGTDLKMIQSRSLFWIVLSFHNTKLYTPTPYFSYNLTTITIPWVLVKLRNLNNLLVNYLNKKFCDTSALSPHHHTYFLIIYTSKKSLFLSFFILCIATTLSFLLVGSGYRFLTG